MVFILFLNFPKVYYLANYSKGKEGGDWNIGKMECWNVGKSTQQLVP
jgi:hypothetical protein